MYSIHVSYTRREPQWLGSKKVLLVLAWVRLWYTYFFCSLDTCHNRPRRGNVSKVKSLLGSPMCRFGWFSTSSGQCTLGTLYCSSTGGERKCPADMIIRGVPGNATQNQAVDNTHKP
jgi:hypothetical protein